MVRFPYRLNTYTKKNDHPLWVAILLLVEMNQPRP